jgi:hypothetical protein
MDSHEAFHVSDPTVVARYLQLRSLFHDRLLARLDLLVQERYDVLVSNRLHATLVALLRTGYARPKEGEVWPVVFLTPIDVTLALCVQITPERMASLGTMIKGPHRMRQRYWEDWWGWETSLAGVHPRFFELPGAEQEDAMLAWYAEGLEWLAHSGLLRRLPKPGPVSAGPA